MTPLIWIGFIILEAYIHYLVIEKFKHDPTPDGQSWWQALPESLFRIAGFCFIFWKAGYFDLVWGVVAHLSWFGPILNLMRDKKPSYLGNGNVDSVLKKVPFGFRVFAPAIVIAVRMILDYWYFLIR
jgi:hypothetical protein